MKNRSGFLPILRAGALLLVACLPLEAQTAATTAAIPAPAATVTATPTVTALPPHTAAYTVVKGDTLTSLATRFNTTRRKLKALNNLADSKISPGQVILVPSYKKSAKTAAEAKPKHHTYLAAQPVQDFDIPASTFASCPVPVPPDDDTEPATTDGKAAPIAQLVSPAELAADQAATRCAAEKAAEKTAVAQALAAAEKASVAPAVATPRHFAGISSGRTTSIRQLPAPSGWANPSTAPQPTSHGGILSFFHSHPSASTPSNDWGNRFIQEARALGDQGIGYDEEWRPPGEPRSWEMDCSNTSRYLYKVTANMMLPRTASDQYYYLHLQGKAWYVPTIAGGLPDTQYLRENLKPGDLLFWENTYRPERQPPITHVMVFLGTDAQGKWIMAGSQGSRGGEHNRRNGGPDIYEFSPSAPCGGYTSWFVHHKGRFVAFGRPLEADPSKFALND